MINFLPPQRSPRDMQADPTPEQLRDDGRADGIPAMTVEQWRALEAISRTNEEREVFARSPHVKCFSAACRGRRKAVPHAP